MNLLTYTPPEKRVPLGAFPHVVPAPAPGVPPIWFQCSLTQFLGLLSCHNCRRTDRQSLQTWRRHFYISCDCGAIGEGSKDLVAAVNWWNHGAHWNANGEMMFEGRAARFGDRRVS